METSESVGYIVETRILGVLIERLETRAPEQVAADHQAGAEYERGFGHASRGRRRQSFDRDYSDGYEAGMYVHF